MKKILTSQKNSFLYIEHCKVSSLDYQLCFTKANGGNIKYFNIPYGNLSVLVLGPGTSITQQAAKLIAGEGMLVAFSSGNMGNLFLTSQSEYRKPIFLQKWFKIWEDEKKRLIAAKYFFNLRLNNSILFWDKINQKILFDNKLNIDELLALNNKYLYKINLVKNNQELLGYEGSYVKSLYKILANQFNDKNFTRDNTKTDDVNLFLNKSNYLAYGISGVVLWTLGIPASLPLFHGNTRNGGLVFDLADTIKDGITLPLSFIASNNNLSSKELRDLILSFFEDNLILSKLFLTIKETLKLFEEIPESFFDEFLI